MPKYDVTVKLSGMNGNAIAILVTVNQGLKKAGVPQSEIDKFQSEATSGGHGRVLRTAKKWVNVA